MKNWLTVLAILMFGDGAIAQNVVPPADIQIKLALLAAPEEKRAGATVYGFDSKGAMTVLRKGTNEMICLADDPARKGFNVSCYHQDMEPLMKRGRELRASGKKMEEIEAIREAEVKAGKIPLNKQPSTLYVVSAKEEDVDLQQATVKNGYLRYVVYIPYATAESTGLPLKEGQPGMPWIMDPGTYRAHIMINPAPAVKQ
jgi:hypothetical protein